MTKYWYLYIILPFFFNKASAQHFSLNWVNQMGGFESSLATTTCTDNNGNVYVSGRIAGSVNFNLKGGSPQILTAKGGADIFIAKYNSNGDYIWAKSMGGGNNEFTNTITVDNQGDIIIIGQFQDEVNFNPSGTFNLSSSGAENTFIAKYTSNGIFKWAKALECGGTSRGHYVVTDDNNNIFITANFSADIDVDPSAASHILTNNQGSFREFLGKYNPNGNFVWAHPLGYGDGGGSSSIPLVNDKATGDVVIMGDISSTFDFSFTGVAGATITTNTKTNYLARYSNSGAFIWVKKLASTGDAHCQAIQINSQNDIVTYGDFTDTFSPGTGVLTAKGGRDAFLCTYTSAGAIKWAQSFGGVGSTLQAAYACLGSNQDIYISGNFVGDVDLDNQSSNGIVSSVNQGRSVLLAKYNATGKALAYDVIGGNCSATSAYRMSIFNDALYIPGGLCETVDFDPSVCSAKNVTAISGSTDIFLGKYSITTTGSITNVISPPAVVGFCNSGDPAAIEGNDITQAGYTFQWQRSTNGINFSNITGATLKSYNPPVTTATTYFRRLILPGCPENASNVVQIAILPPGNCIPTIPSDPQQCGSPGADGPANISSSVNTYFPPLGNLTVTAGSTTMNLGPVPATDAYGNSFGSSPIKVGDVLLIIQMQDAEINSSNTTLYGSGINDSGADGQGATGYTNLGSSGLYEYVIATTEVPVTGGVLTLRGSSNNNGTVYTYTNSPATASRGKRSFQIIRIPQYSYLKLVSNITAPPFNGRAGGVVAFNVAGEMDMNGYTIDASARGFRGGYSLVKASVGNIRDLYVAQANNQRVSGKGEGIAGTPRYMWDGYNEIDNIIEGLPSGSGGRGAPANGGGGGNDSNAGGGGGANAGAGGNGGGGYAPIGGDLPSGGRPGFATLTNLTRLIMGGGGGGGHANDAVTGVKGGVGGGVIIINAIKLKGTGTIRSNGSDGSKGVSGPNPDGSGGGGAGGTVFLNISDPSSAPSVNIEVRGGAGGNTERDPGGGGVQPHGPGGGGGGGQIYYTIANANVLANVSPGVSGVSNGGAGIPNGATIGQPGNSTQIVSSILPPYLQYPGLSCLAELVTTMEIDAPLVPKSIGTAFSYTIKVTNNAQMGGAAGVQVACLLPPVINIQSATVSYQGNAGGPTVIANRGTALKPLFGDFNISAGGSVIITINATASCGAASTYHSSAQALYLDPTRTSADPNRRITPTINHFSGSVTEFQSGMGDAPGQNYDGQTSANEDLTLAGSAAFANTINAPLNTLYCKGANPTVITGNLPAGNNITYQWQQSANGTAFTDINGATTRNYDPPVINNDIWYRRVVNTTDCSVPSISNVINLTVYPIISNNTITAPSPTTFCGLSPPVTITGSVPTGGSGTYTYQWLSSTTDDVNSYTIINGAVAKNYTTPVTNVTLYYKRMVYSQTCNDGVSSPALVLTVTPLPVKPQPTFAHTQVCAGSTVPVAVLNPLPGLTYRWYADVARTNLLYTGTNYVTNPINATVTFYLEAANNGCVSAEAGTVEIVVAQPAVAPNVDNMQPVCPGSTVTLAVNNLQPGAIYKWYLANTGSAPVFTGNSYTVQIDAPIVYYVEADNNCPSLRTPVAVNVLGLPDAPTLPTQTICPGTPATLSTGTNSLITINWYESVNGGTPVFTGDNFITPALNSNKTYYTEAVSSTSGCVNPNRSAVNVVMAQALAAPVVSVGQTTFNSVTFNWNAVAGAASYEVSTDNGQTFTNTGTNNNSYTVGSLSNGQTATLIIKALGALSCQQSATSLAVTGTAVDPLSIPVFVPNVFSPNGDGNNDVLYVRSSAISNMSFMIYNQWGQLVFRTANQANGWDGTFKGSPQPVGVYVYYVEMTLLDGKKMNKKGTVTLLR